MIDGHGGEVTRPGEGFGRDPEIAAWLRTLDPAGEDVGYWLRFRDWVVESAAPELARRRMLAQVTMGEVLRSWSRTLVPTALLAAAVAGLALLRGPAVPEATPVAVEELLVSELGDLPIPAALAPSMGSAVSVVTDPF
jgi:hypothetical protein